MKKIFKSLFLILVAIFIVFLIIFHKRLLLCYGIAEKYISLKNEISNIEQVDINSVANSMNYKDVVYKNTNGVPLTLDIYGPMKQVYKSSPVIVYVHGGSWAYGNKALPSSLAPVLDTFREEGYTIISTSYELMHEKENFNKQVSDIKDTIRWIHKNSSTYNFDTNEIGILGVSSGAHVSLMAAYSPNENFVDDTELCNFSSSVKYLVDFAGPTDLGILDTTNLNFDLSNIFSSISNKSDVIEKYNPINYVHKDSPDTLIIHSKSDMLVPFESSEKLYEKCVQEKAKSKLIALNSSSHDLSEISTKDIIAVSKGLLIFVISKSPL